MQFNSNDVTFTYLPGLFSATDAVTLTSSLIDNKYACDNIVTFTCEVEAQVPVLTWTIGGFINPDSRKILTFASTVDVGDRQDIQINDNTYAELTMNDGQGRLVSTLYINVTLIMATASVKCDNGSKQKNTSFTVLGM